NKTLDPTPAEIAGARPPSCAPSYDIVSESPPSPQQIGFGVAIFRGFFCPRLPAVLLHRRLIFLVHSTVKFY
ncbi:unnamed protein product, partial [Linum tenue]